MAKAPSELGVKPLTTTRWKLPSAEPVPYFYKLLVNPAMSPVYKPAIEKFGEKWTQPGNIVTNGAYTLKDWWSTNCIVMGATRTTGIMLKPSLTPLPGCRPLPK